jgi:inner membrane transporter RhtA
MNHDSSARLQPAASLSLLLPIAALLVAMVSIQLGASFAKSLFPMVGAEGTTALRLGFSALILTVVLRPWRARIGAANWRSVTVYGLSLGGMNLMFYLALQTIPLGIAVSLEFSGPLAVAVWASRRPADFAWIGLAVIGLLLLLPFGQASHGLDPLGVAYAFGAAACWGLYIVFGQRAGAEHGAQASVLGTIVAAVVVLPVGVAHAGAALWAPAVLPMAVLVAILSSALPASLEMLALRRLPAQTFGTLTSIEPAIGALTGFVFLSEKLQPLQWVAVGVIVLASIGTTLTIKPGIASLPD